MTGRHITPSKASRQADRAKYRENVTIWFALSLVVVLVVSVPTMVWAEAGVPMIDQPGNLWLVPVIIVVSAFVGGGAVVGSRQRGSAGAVAAGVALGALGAAVLIGADVLRRLHLSQGFSPGVARLWVTAAAGVALAGGLGALGGYLVFGRRRGSLAPQGPRRRGRTPPDLR